MPILLVLVLLLAAPLAAQDGPAYADPVARQLVERARASREEIGRSIRAYTAVVTERQGVRLRLPLRDRLLASEESAARVRWSRDGETVVQVLASREQEPDGVEPGRGISGRWLFDPTADRLYFGLPRPDRDGETEEVWIADPLAAGAEAHYRFRSGDSITVRLPDGWSIRTIELHVVPRRPSFRYMTAVLWIDDETGALVQAVYRPSRDLDLQRDTTFLDADAREGMRRVPGMLKPMGADIGSIVVQYSLWGRRHWLPRMMRIDGYGRAGVVRVPFEAEVTYRITSVEDDTPGPAPASSEDGLAGFDVGPEMERRERERDDGRTIVVYRPKDRSALLESADLPPPIWEDAPELVSEEEVERLAGVLARAVPRHELGEPVRFGVEWGPGAPGLTRYNRVEGLSLGARGSVEASPGRGWATLRLGSADLHPNAELGISIPRDRRALEVAAYHRLASVDGSALGAGNSLGAFLLGRDDGEYFRATGARIVLAPAESERAWYRWTLFAERQRAVERETEWSVSRALGGEPLRPNLVADPADLAGVGLSLSPWWGSDPRAPQGGVEVVGEGVAGDYSFARGSVTARAVVPAGARWRLGAEAGGGTSAGEVPAQYRWFLGGPATLRGYPASSLVGSSFARLRGEVARGTAAGAIALFGDAAWAGERSLFDESDALYSAGVGLSVLDGLVRVDAARALRGAEGWRLELYLDGLF